jgi:hypothetical protein
MTTWVSVQQASFRQSSELFRVAEAMDHPGGRPILAENDEGSAE